MHLKRGLRAAKGRKHCLQVESCRLMTKLVWSGLGPFDGRGQGRWPPALRLGYDRCRRVRNTRLLSGYGQRKGLLGDQNLQPIAAIDISRRSVTDLKHPDGCGSGMSCASLMQFGNFAPFWILLACVQRGFADNPPGFGGFCQRNERSVSDACVRRAGWKGCSCPQNAAR